MAFPWTSRTLSTAKVENVVKAPQKPSPKSKYGFPVRPSPQMMPSSNAPVVLMRNVPNGKVCFSCLRIRIPSLYRAMAPNAPPKLNNTKFTMHASVPVALPQGFQAKQRQDRTRQKHQHKMRTKGHDRKSTALQNLCTMWKMWCIRPENRL